MSPTGLFVVQLWWTRMEDAGILRQVIKLMLRWDERRKPGNSAPVADDGLGAVLRGELPHLHVAVLAARHQLPARL